MRNLDHTNPYLLLSLFLIFFVAYVLMFHEDAMIADEARYVQFAGNLLQGFYSPAPPNIDLWCGPGYPIMLTPFIAIGLPLISITLLNAVLQYLSIVLLFMYLKKFVSFGWALGCSLFWALCYSSYTFVAMIHTEVTTWFLFTLFAYLVLKHVESGLMKYIIYAGITLGFLALVKILIGYVLLTLLLGLTVLLVWRRKSAQLKSSLQIVLVAFLTVSPYLIYTYSLTGRVFYWGNSGGMSLYWMSTPYEHEYGDWNNEDFNALADWEFAGSAERLRANHEVDIAEVNQYTGVEKDDAYKRLAIENIKANPKKYVKNIIANISRAVLGFPYSYSFQRPLSKTWYFAILFTMVLFSGVLTVLTWRRTEYSIRLILAVVMIYLGGSSLLSMENRMFLAVVPILILWIGITLNRSVSLRLKL